MHLNPDFTVKGKKRVETKMKSISSTKKTWEGHERRKIKRRVEDLRIKYTLVKASH